MKHGISLICKHWSFQSKFSLKDISIKMLMWPRLYFPTGITNFLTRTNLLANQYQKSASWYLIHSKASIPISFGGQGLSPYQMCSLTIALRTNGLELDAFQCWKRQETPNGTWTQPGYSTYHLFATAAHRACHFICDLSSPPFPKLIAFLCWNWTLKRCEC